MKDDRLRQPIKSDYMDALGTAAFCFAICEWNAVYCAERICPRSLHVFVRDELTAGKIAKKLLDLARDMPKSPERAEVIAAAQSFSDLVPLRNSILHGKPCTGPSGEARLSTVKVFEIPDLQDAADAFSTCSIELNRILYGFLATYEPSGAPTWSMMPRLNFVVQHLLGLKEALIGCFVAMSFSWSVVEVFGD